MSDSRTGWPLDGSGHLAAALVEQGTPPAEAEKMAAALMPLAEWRAPDPTPAETERLVSRLMPLARATAPVRQAVRARRTDRWAELELIVRVARAQVTVLQPAFWLTSAIIVLAGGFAGSSQADANRAFVLQVVGPLLGYIGAARAFRGIGLNTLEFELACPPSPRQLTIARLAVVLGYDIALGVLLSLALGAQGGEGLLRLSLHWLAPLLLVSGLTLVLSLRWPVHQAAAATYMAWLAALVMALVAQQRGAAPAAGETLTMAMEWGAGFAGAACLGLAVRAAPAALPRMLPRS